MPEQFWKTNPLILIHPKYLHRFFPAPSFTISERMNAIVRLGAYIGVGLAIVQKSMTWVLLPIVAMVITMAWTSDGEGDEIEQENHTPKHSKEKRAYIYLANEIVNGKTHKKIYPKKIHSKTSHNKNIPIKTRLYNDLDTNLQSMRNDRAYLTKQMDTGLNDTTGFARKMMKRDKERFLANGRKKYSRK